MKINQWLGVLMISAGFAFAAVSSATAQSVVDSDAEKIDFLIEYQGFSADLFKAQLKASLEPAADEGVQAMMGQLKSLKRDMTAEEDLEARRKMRAYFFDTFNDTFNDDFFETLASDAEQSMRQMLVTELDSQELDIVFNYYRSPAGAKMTGIQNIVLNDLTAQMNDPEVFQHLMQGFVSRVQGLLADLQ